jgi:hypothetical protein
MENGMNAENGCYTEHGVSGYGVAANLSTGTPMDTDFIKKFAEETMMLVAQKCMDEGARCIGHIKSHIRTQAGTIKADTIGTSHGTYSTGNLEHPVDTFYIAINSIVQGIKEDVVRKATLDGLHEVATSRMLTVLKEKEHTYFDEFDFVTSKQEYIKQLGEQLSGNEKKEG